MIVEVQWHSPDMMFAAVFIRDGQPWILNGALVGMGGTRGAAVEDLVALAGHLVREGGNFLTDNPVPVTDRRWLFNQIDSGADSTDNMYAALRQAEEQAIKHAPAQPPASRTTAHYEASVGIRPPRAKAGRVRGVAYEMVPGGGMELWHCGHDHAPGVNDMQRILPHQYEAAANCAEEWLNSQVFSGALQPMPVTRAER